MMTFGELVRSARLLRGMTQVEVARLAGTNVTTLVHIEKGTTRSTSFYNALRLCAALGIQLDAAAAATLYENLPPKLDDLPERVRLRLEAIQKPAIRYSNVPVVKISDP